jgi:hypothetical protein
MAEKILLLTAQAIIATTLTEKSVFYSTNRDEKIEIFSWDLP